MVWLTWNHPEMPWLTTEAWVGEVANDGMLRNARRVAGGADEALFQPEWSPDGDLYLVSDQGKGWWNLYRERDGALEPMAPREAEFGRPQWTFGMSTYAFESAERIICCFFEDGKWNLAKLNTRTKRFDPIPTRIHGCIATARQPGKSSIYRWDANRTARPYRSRSEYGDRPCSSALGSPKRRGSLLHFNAGVDNVYNSGR